MDRKTLETLMPPQQPELTKEQRLSRLKTTLEDFLSIMTLICPENVERNLATQKIVEAELWIRLSIERPTMGK